MFRETRLTATAGSVVELKKGRARLTLTALLLRSMPTDLIHNLGIKTKDKNPKQIKDEAAMYAVSLSARSVPYTGVSDNQF